MSTVTTRTTAHDDVTLASHAAVPAPPIVSPWLLAALSVACLLGVVWLAGLQAQLPLAALPAAGTPSSALEPGQHPVVGSPVRFSGTWIQQPLGPKVWMTTDRPGSSLSFTFYGTRVVAMLRVGPQAGTVYATIDGKPAPGLKRDRTGAYLSLSGIRAAAEPITVVTGLNHGQHRITLTNGANGQLAIVSIDVVNQTPFPWAFAVGDTFLCLGLFVTVRGLMVRGATHLGWLTGERALTVGSGRRRGR